MSQDADLKAFEESLLTKCVYCKGLKWSKTSTGKYWCLGCGGSGFNKTCDVVFYTKTYIGDPPPYRDKQNG